MKYDTGPGWAWPSAAVGKWLAFFSDRAHDLVFMEFVLLSFYYGGIEAFVYYR
jgi:hypothetical protein